MLVFSVPEQVLREEPDAPCYHNLKHSELNIEIRPWKVSDVRTSVTTEVMSSDTDDVTTSGDEALKTEELDSVHTQESSADLVPSVSEVSEVEQDETDSSESSEDDSYDAFKGARLIHRKQSESSESEEDNSCDENRGTQLSSSACPVGTTHQQKHQSEQGEDVDMGSDSEIYMPNEEEDASVEQQESPKTDVAHSEHVSSPKGTNLHLDSDSESQDVAAEEDLSVELQSSPGKGIEYVDQMFSPRDTQLYLHETGVICEPQGVTAEEDVSIELQSSPRRGIEHREHVVSPFGREQDSPLVRSEDRHENKELVNELPTKDISASGQDVVGHNAVAQLMADGMLFELKAGAPTGNGEDGHGVKELSHYRY